MNVIVVSFVSLCVLIWLGHMLRMRISLLQKLYLPSSVIAGLLGLIVIQIILYVAQPPMPQRITDKAPPNDWQAWQVGAPAPQSFPGRAPESGWPSATTFLVLCTSGWGKLPGFLINIVFACLFLGMVIPNLKTVWRRAGPQLAYGQIVAWGQYVVGIGLFLTVITYTNPELPAMFAGILPVGFEGGHGTAAGMAQTFATEGWAAGKDYALASATFGILGAVIVGMALVNWAQRKGYVVRQRSPQDFPEDDTIGVISVDRRPEAGKLTVSSSAIESLTLHLAIVGLAVGIGWAMKQGLLFLGQASQSQSVMKMMDSFPLFPLCMIGGLIVQVIHQKYDRHKLIDSGLMRRIQNIALDFLVVAAIATINVKVIQAGLVPLLVLVAAGILWNVFCVVGLARRLLPDAWFERSIAEMGQSMGVTATGLMLLRVVDPDYESPAADAFAYKQILHEPFMGGGLWTGAAIPLIALWGGWPVFAIALGAVVLWLVFAMATGMTRRSS